MRQRVWRREAEEGPTRVGVRSNSAAANLLAALEDDARGMPLLDEDLADCRAPSGSSRRGRAQPPPAPPRSFPFRRARHPTRRASPRHRPGSREAAAPPCRACGRRRRRRSRPGSSRRPAPARTRTTARCIRGCRSWRPRRNGPGRRATGEGRFARGPAPRPCRPSAAPAGAAASSSRWRAPGRQAFRAPRGTPASAPRRVPRTCGTRPGPSPHRPRAGENGSSGNGWKNAGSCLTTR